MKRIALAVAVVVMAAGACKKAQNSNTAADSTRADSMRMADSMKMAPGDTSHMMDTTKARTDTSHAPAHKTTTRTRKP